jgi:hypothetical protein
LLGGNKRRAPPASSQRAWQRTTRRFGWPGRACRTRPHRARGRDPHRARFDGRAPVRPRHRWHGRQRKVRRRTSQARRSADPARASRRSVSALHRCSPWTRRSSSSSREEAALQRQIRSTRRAVAIPGRGRHGAERSCSPSRR